MIHRLRIHGGNREKLIASMLISGKILNLKCSTGVVGERRFREKYVGSGSTHTVEAAQRIKITHQSHDISSSR